MITGFVTGADKVIGRFKAIHPRVMEEVKKTTLKIGFDLTGYVKSRKLSGQVLKNRSDHLRASIHPTFTDTDTSSTGIVGTNVEYAAAHEYGGPYTVREHLRMMTQAWGRPVKNPRQITVKAHTCNMPEASFLRSSLRDNLSSIQEQYRAAVARGSAP
jgi:phage gpG-like protein